MKFDLIGLNEMVELNAGWVRGVPRLDVEVVILDDTVLVSAFDITVGEENSRFMTIDFLNRAVCEKYDATTVSKDALDPTILVRNLAFETRGAS